jgi:hypothetical protein
MYPPAVCSQSRILTGGDDRSASRADLPGSTRLVVLRIEVGKFPVLAVVLLYLALGRVLAILRQHALGLLPETFRLLPHALFLAVLGRQRHRGPRYVRDRRAFPWCPSLTLPLATLRAIPYGHGRASPMLADIRDSQAVRDLICVAQLAQRARDTMQPRAIAKPLLTSSEVTADSISFRAPGRPVPSAGIGARRTRRTGPSDHGLWSPVRRAPDSLEHKTVWPRHRVLSTNAQAAVLHDTEAFRPEPLTERRTGRSTRPRCLHVNARQMRRERVALLYPHVLGLTRMPASQVRSAPLGFVRSAAPGGSCRGAPLTAACLDTAGPTAGGSATARHRACRGGLRVEAPHQRLRCHLRRPVPGRRDLLTQPPETQFEG